MAKVISNTTSQQNQTAIVGDIRYVNALAAIKLVGASQVLDMTEDDFAFLIGEKLWTATDRSRARRVVEASVYGALDYLAFPRFAVPAEFIAAAIAFYVHPSNIMTACLIMEGCEWSENVIRGVERPAKANELFAHVIRIKSGCMSSVNAAEETARNQFNIQAGA